MQKVLGGIVVFLEDWVPATILVVMTLLVVFDVSGRYVLNATVPGTSELATAMFVWLVFLGSAGAVRRYQHIAVDTIVALLPARLRVAVQFSCLVAILAISLYIAKLSTMITLQSQDREIEVLHLSYLYIYGVVPICFALIIVHTCSQILDVVRNGSRAQTLQSRLPSDVEV